jgi:cytochrome b561
MPLKPFDRRDLALRLEKLMIVHMQYGTPAKIFHWLVVALLMVQYPLGWLMPDVHAGPPGKAMTFHISVGDAIAIRQTDGWQYAEWGLLIAIGNHVTAALVHVFVLRDLIMKRMMLVRRKT